MEVGPLVVTELERPREALDHLTRHLLPAPLFEPHVILAADARERGELLTLQPRHPPLVVGQPEGDRIQLRPPRLQELRELARPARRAHRRISTISTHAFTIDTMKITMNPAATWNSPSGLPAMSRMPPTSTPES